MDIRFVSRTLLCIAAVLCIASAAVAKNGGSGSNTELANGVNAYKQKHFEEAFQWFQKSAKEGNANGEYLLGLSYALGIGVPKDLSQAAHWFKPAADAGIVSAQYYLGFLEYKGLGVNQNLPDALYQFERAANQGNSNAEDQLGFFYEMGLAIEQNYGTAFQWYEESAKAGNAKGQLHLGRLYRDGHGTPKDLQKAEYWLRKSADQNNEAAKKELADIGAGTMDSQSYGELHILARKNIGTLADLEGKRIMVGAKGSVSQIAAANVFLVLGIKPAEIYEADPANGIVAVLDDKADAVVVVGGKPFIMFKNMEHLADIKTGDNAGKLSQVHFLPIEDARLVKEYGVSILTHSDYNYVENDVPTVVINAGNMGGIKSHDNPDNVRPLFVIPLIWLGLIGIFFGYDRVSRHRCMVQALFLLPVIFMAISTAVFAADGNTTAGAMSSDTSETFSDMSDNLKNVQDSPDTVRDTETIRSGESSGELLPKDSIAGDRMEDAFTDAMSDGSSDTSLAQLEEFLSRFSDLLIEMQNDNFHWGKWHHHRDHRDYAHNPGMHQPNHVAGGKGHHTARTAKNAHNTMRAARAARSVNSRNGRNVNYANNTHAAHTQRRQGNFVQNQGQRSPVVRAPVVNSYARPMANPMPSRVYQAPATKSNYYVKGSQPVYR